MAEGAVGAWLCWVVAEGCRGKECPAVPVPAAAAITIITLTAQNLNR
jgi:hypothetical protein